MNIQNSLDWIIKKRIVIFGCLIIMLVYLRLYYGVDLTDEGGYVAAPYHMTLGAKPFREEVVITQNGGILIYPFIKLYTMMVPRADGLVLAIRHLYFLLVLFAARTVFVFARKWMAFSLALLISLLPVVYIYCGRPTICYNTLALFGIMIGGISFLEVLLKPNAPSFRSTTIGICAFAAATYAYPTFILVSAPAILLFVARVNDQFQPRTRNQVFAWVTAVSLPWLAFALWSGYYAGISNIHRSIEYYAQFGAFGGIEKFKWLTWALGIYKWYATPILACMFAVWISGRPFKFRGVVIAGIVVALIRLIWISTEPVADQLLLVMYAGLIPFLFFARLKNFPLMFELKALWLLSLWSGTVFAWTSNTGLSSSPLGLVTSMLLSLLAMGALIEERSWPKSRIYVFEFFLGGFAAFLLLTGYQYYHQDGPFMALTAPMSSGPYAGIRTFPEKKQMLEELTSDLNAQRPRARSVMFFNDFPGGYLLTDLSRHAQSNWTPSLAYPHFSELRSRNVLGWFDHEDKLPDLVVHLISYFYMKGQLRKDDSKNDEVLAFFSRPNYRVIVAKPSYVIYERNYR